jgi:hypothetical protein
MQMIFSFLIFFFVLCVFLTTGVVFSAVLGSQRKIEQIALSFLVSSSIFTYDLFLLYDFWHVRFTATNLFWELFVYTLTAVVANWCLQKVSWRQTLRWTIAKIFEVKNLYKSDLTSFVLIVSISFSVMFTLAQNIFWPIADWDSLALYDFRAKVFAMSGGMEDGIRRGYFLHYPLYTSFLHTISYLFSIGNPKIWFTTLYVSLLLVFYFLLRRDLSRKLSLLGCFILAVSPRIFQHAQMSYTNLPQAIFLSLGYLYLLYWWKKGLKKDLLIGSFLIAFSTWIRLTEPLWLFSFPLLLLGALRYRRQFLWVASCGFFIFFLQHPWNVFVLEQSQVSPIASIGLIDKVKAQFSLSDVLPRFEDVFAFLMPGVFAMIQPYVLAILFSLTHLIYKRKWVKVFDYLFWFFLLVMIVLGTFIFSYIFPGWKDIPDSAARMAMFLLPICVYLIMQSDLWVFSRNKKSGKSRRHK